MGSSFPSIANEPGLTTAVLRRPPFQLEAMFSARVLVVEDEHLVALDIHRSLERMGHVVVGVYSGEDALDAVARTPIDLVLMDIKLSGKLDGIETARIIRESQDIPIIYLTAYADNRTLERARVTEPYGYVLKPFQERELKAAIEMALQRHASDQLRRNQEELQRFLGDATTLMAATLDYRAVATAAADLLVPRHADWCALRLNETDDAIPACMYTRPNGGSELVSSGNGARLIESVMLGGRSALLPDVTHPHILDALGSQHDEALRAIGARSLVCVPLIARGQVLGALALVRGRTRSRFGAADLVFVEDFGNRLGMALDNALLYRKAECALRMRDDVLAIVSHDLRTPLSTILLQAETLADGGHAKAAGSIARAARRMTRLIGDLLDASAVNAGKLTLAIEVLRLDDVVREAIEMFRSQAGAAGVELRDELPPDAVYVSCDRDRILQVLANLIGNAVKFTAAGGSVTARMIRLEEGVRVEVVDTGRGISREQLPHLFDRFWRAEARRHGAGLGLFIARGIVTAHGSELEVETEVGQGSRFFFVLPERRW